ncbi:MAG: radical SAM protein [Candidatus Latescibacterota bacterium]|nr:MAG: radical SAM protein [Candidatus Latescibacterota bacterium]
MRILLINPPAINFYHRVGLTLPPLGLGYIAAVLVDAGHQVQIADLNVEPLNYDRYPYENFNLVGISVDTTRYPVSLKIAQAAKRHGRPVVVGGPHVTFFDEETLRTGLVDYVVRNEGEHIMLDLVRHLEDGHNLEEVQGISSMQDGQFVRTPAAPFVQDLDALPFPARNLLPLDRYITTLRKRPMATMVTSRGCPYNCEFCSASQFSGVKWRTRSVGNILEELEFLYDRYGYRAVAFLDDNFTLNPDRVLEVCKGIMGKGWDLFWWCFSRVDTIVRNPKMVADMARSGVREIFIGFESGSQKVLDQIGKNLSVDKAVEAVKILQKHHIAVWGSFMIGALNETKAMINETIRFAKRLNPDQAQFSIMTPYPGTRLYASVKDRLLTHDWKRYWGGEPIIRLDKVSPKDMERLIFKAYLSFYLRFRKLFRLGIPYFYNLMGGYRRHKKAPLRMEHGDWVPI